MTLPSSFVFFTLVFYFLVNVASSISQHPKLLVISYDGFRYDYFDPIVTPFMNELRTNGTYSEYMFSVYPTKTFPNHLSIATGMYPETHGVVANSVYDPKLERVVKYSAELYSYDNRTEPIWITNEKAGSDRHSGCMMWSGSNFPYQGTMPTFFKEYDSSIPYEDRVDELISWFTDSATPINLGMLYVEQPDTTGHVVGIQSPLYFEMLRKIDDLTEYIRDELRSAGLQDVNVVHVSDHGMESVPLSRIIDLRRYVNKSDFISAGGSPNPSIFPKPGKFYSVYEQLVKASRENGHFTVYKREEIPERYKFRNNPRIGDIFLETEMGYAFDDLYGNIAEYEKFLNFTANNQSQFGVHGWDNEAREMRAMFFAYGPAFRAKHRMKPFVNINLFPLFCEVLELSCPKTNGTLENVRGALKSFEGCSNWNWNTFGEYVESFFY